MRLQVVLGLTIGIAMAVAGCYHKDGGGDNETENGAMPPTGGDNETAPVNLSVAVSDVPPNAFRFVPAALAAPANATVNVAVTSAGGVTGNRFPHNFVIDELGVNMGQIQPGASGNVTFLATAPGDYPYYCDVDNHRQLGMQGTLTVE